ncbi:hypothetical protein PTKIN_Ptkin08bG0063700 [Pterospermum kingtungense]
MWSYASSCTAGTVGLKNDPLKQTHDASECSDNESSFVVSRDEGLECPICCEFFNIVENVPYVLWCGHTLCKNCILRLQSAVVKYPALPLQFPIFISCPWCNLWSFRLLYRGNLSHSSLCEDRQPDWSSNNNLAMGNQVTRSNHRREHHSESAGSSNHHTYLANCFNLETIYSTLWKSLVFL